VIALTELFSISLTLFSLYVPSLFFFFLMLIGFASPLRPVKMTDGFHLLLRDFPETWFFPFVEF